MYAVHSANDGEQERDREPEKQFWLRNAKK